MEKKYVSVLIRSYLFSVSVSRRIVGNHRGYRHKRKKGNWKADPKTDLGLVIR